MSTEDDGPLEVVDTCRDGDRALLIGAINAYNMHTTKITDGRVLACLLRRPDGSIVAGIYGWTWGGFFEIETLWVSRGRRRSGLGTRLLAAAEEEARRRGVRQIGLSTHSFQAPDFYRERGYVVLAVQPDDPVGHSRIFLTKRLD